MKIAPKNVALNEVLIRRGLSKTDLGEAVGIGVSYAIQICNGSRNPGPRTARKICEALEVDFDDIFEIVRSNKQKKVPTASAK